MIDVARADASVAVPWRGTVLVVDDEASVRASIRAILEETCEVIEAEDGAAALEILKTREVDIVMLDQRMPGEPGIDVLSRVKAADPSTVVVIATAVREVRTAVDTPKPARGALEPHDDRERETCLGIEVRGRDGATRALGPGDE